MASVRILDSEEQAEHSQAESSETRQSSTCVGTQIPFPSPSAASRTSSRTIRVFGLGASITDDDRTITGAKLPCGRQVLRCMLYNCDKQLYAKRPGSTGALSRFSAAKVVLEQVKLLYNKAGIPMVSDRRACDKMVGLVQDNNKLRRISYARRSSKATVCQVDAMERKLDATFPLWPPNAEKLIRQPWDVAFLASMKGDRVATFGSRDKKLQSKVQRKQDRTRQAHAFQEKHQNTATLSTDLTDCECESSEEEDSNPDEETGSQSMRRKQRQLKKSVTTAFIPADILSRPHLVSLATRLKLTPMKQAAFTRALIAESGGDCEKVATSYATADRSRRQVLEAISAECHAQWIPPPMSTLHWDSKLTPTLTNARRLEERLTVVVGDAKQLKLLGVPAYTKGSNEACGTIIARLICNLLEEWNCANQVINMAFDTTSSNTGHLSAACIAIQLSLNRPLLWSGCRHHIGEVLLTHIFNDLKVESSRSPEVSLFMRLRDHWNLVPHDNTDKLSCYIFDDTEPSFLVNLRQELVLCASEMADYKRGDYREFIQLCLVYVEASGSSSLTPVVFQRPGALHKARWMAKLIYTLKLALMEHHIANLPQGTITTKKQVPKIRAFSDFITHVYAAWWLTCDKAIDAAWNDLQLHHHLHSYKSVDTCIAESAIKALERHLWYLTGEMLPLALFSTKVPREERRALADSILALKPEPNHLPMRVPQLRFGTGFGKPKFPVILPSTRLADLINVDCWFGIHQLKINPQFLPLDVEKWAENRAFQESLSNVVGINVVNDCAERGVKLTSDFVAAARGEQHLQNVLQTVEQDRHKQPNLRFRKRKMYENEDNKPLP